MRLRELLHSFFEAKGYSPPLFFKELLMQAMPGSSDLPVLRDILEAARRNDAAFTFFILGSTARRFPWLPRFLARQGHEVATHGMRHLAYGRLSPSAALSDLRASCDVFRSIGVEVSGFRPPFLSMNSSVYPAAASLGLKYVSSCRGSGPFRVPGLDLREMPVVSPYDWELVVARRVRSADALGSFFASHLSDGSVFLFHPWVLGMVDYASILDRLLSSRLDCISMSDLCSGEHGFCMTFDIGKISGSELLCRLF